MTSCPGTANDLADLGLNPGETLWTLTSRAADVGGLGRRNGRLAAGHDADLLAVKDNPLADLSALRRVEGVYRPGDRVGGSGGISRGPDGRRRRSPISAADGVLPTGSR
jgi:imidazolonepropionase-like amidohydrolase